jgi:hypothetical protein
MTTKYIIDNLDGSLTEQVIYGGLSADTFSATTLYVDGSQITKPYKVYTALLTQSGTTAPVDTVLENTTNIIGSFERWADGRYYLNFTSSITIDKFFIPNSGTYQDTAGVAITLYDGSAVVGYVTLAPYFTDSTNISKLIIDCNNSLGNYTDLSNLIGLGGIYIEIRVYN